MKGTLSELIVSRSISRLPSMNIISWNRYHFHGLDILGRKIEVQRQAFILWHYLSAIWIWDEYRWL